MTDDSRRTDSLQGIPRRTILTGAIGAAAGFGGGVVASRQSAAMQHRSGDPDPPDGEPGELRAISMAMHVHGSFSEGVGSYEAHLHQARHHGVDVIWWTDHDFRVAAHGYRTAVRFDGLTEYDRHGVEWRWEQEREGDLSTASAQFVANPRSPDESGRAMRLAARGSGVLWCHGVAWNLTYSVSLADTTIELDALAEEAGPGRELMVEIRSSYHPARSGRPAGRYVVQYRIGGVDEPKLHTDGLLGVVELPAPHGQWERLQLRPVADIERLWPDLVAEDNSLHQISVGVHADPAAPTRWVVDRLRFDRGAGQGRSAIDLRHAVLARYADEYPDITWFESFEVSLVRHLNWIGGELALPEFPAAPRRDNDPDLAEEMVEFMHGHGALVQWCHPLDASGPDELLRLMIERNNLGADLVEIGRRPYDRLRRVLDVAARNAVFFTAVGVSDDHFGADWLDRPDNQITYVWAVSTKQADLMEALASGRAWWGDPSRWRGELDIRLGEASVLGGVAVTDAAEVDLAIVATGVPSEGNVAVVESPVDLPGPRDLRPSTSVTRLSGTDISDGRARYAVTPRDGCFVRLQVRTADDEILAESNPLWLLRRPPPHGIPEARRIRIEVADPDDG